MDMDLKGLANIHLRFFLAHLRLTGDHTSAARMPCGDNRHWLTFISTSLRTPSCPGHRTFKQVFRLPLMSPCRYLQLVCMIGMMTIPQFTVASKDHSPIIETGYIDICGL